MNGKFDWIKNKYIIAIAEVVYCIMLAFCFSLTSPMNPWWNADLGIDSSVFNTTAMMMRNGHMLYRDLFEHKGPLVYLIDCAGQMIASYQGVWFLEWIFLTIALIFMYKMATLVCKKRYAAVIILAALFLLKGFYQHGNLVEEYAVCFIAVSLFIFVDYFLNRRISRLRLIVCGFCMGAVLLLRPNMISLWIVMCIAVFVRVILEKDYKSLRTFIIFFLLGMAIIMLPIGIWLFCNDALIPCFKDYIVFNFKYTNREAYQEDVDTKFDVFWKFLKVPIFFGALLAQLYALKDKKRFFNVVYFIYMIVTLALISVVPVYYAHYGMILVPAVVYPLAYICSKIDETKRDYVLAAICAFLILYITYPDIKEASSFLLNIYQNRNNDNVGAYHRTIAEYITANTTEDETISVYGNYAYAYILSERKPATKYLYQFPIGQVDPNILDEYFEQLKVEMPRVIVVRHWDDRISEFVENNGYEMVWAEKEELRKGVAVYKYSN